MPMLACAVAWHLWLRPAPLSVIAGEDPRSPMRRGDCYTRFFFNIIPDSKRQQTTTVDYKRLING